MVVVHQATDLEAMDFFNSDPYCIVRCVSCPGPSGCGGDMGFPCQGKVGRFTKVEV